MPGANPNAFRTGSLKGKILNLAQTSVYQVKIQPPEKIRQFMNRTGRKFNYNKDGENMELMCHETSLPGTSLTTHEVTNDYPGVREKMAYRRMYDDTLDMTFYVDKEYGGIGSAPKFPQPASLEWLLRYWRKTALDNFSFHSKWYSSTKSKTFRICIQHSPLGLWWVNIY